MLKSTILALVLASVAVLAGCSSSPTTSSSPAELRVCPYLVPYCPPECNLVGHCPQQCQCPQASGGHVTLCGADHCTGTQTCCPPAILSQDGGTGTYTCVDGDVCPY